MHNIAVYSIRSTISNNCSQFATVIATTSKFLLIWNLFMISYRSQNLFRNDFLNSKLSSFLFLAECVKFLAKTRVIDFASLLVESIRVRIIECEICNILLISNNIFYKQYENPY